MNKCVCIKELKTFDGNLYEEGRLYEYYTIITDIHIVTINNKEYGFMPPNYPLKDNDDCLFSDYFELIDYYRDTRIDSVIGQSA